MNKSKVAPLILLLVLALGVIAFPLFMPDSPQEKGTSATATSLTAATETTLETATKPTAAYNRKPTDTRRTHSTVSRKHTPPHKKTSVSVQVDKNGAYYDVEHVILYLDIYGTLPSNYITKKQAQALGWNGGAVGRVKSGAAIGGDRFGNYEKQLPTGVFYTECDIDTANENRGAKRLIFSNDGHYYYTEDHYKTFTEYVVREGRAEPK